MKYQNRHRKRCSNKKSNISVLNRAIQKNRKKFKWKRKWINGHQIVYNRKCKEYRIVSMKINPTEYVIYSVLNTGVNMNLGVAVIMITCSILGLSNKLAIDQVKNVYINEWEKAGKIIFFVRAHNHKHLKYIEREAKFVSLDTHAICHNGTMLVLSVFGRKEEIEYIFDGLSYIQ